MLLPGGFEFDFSSNVDNVEEGIKIVSKGILQYGVTSYCPTIITSSPEVYKKVFQISCEDCLVHRKTALITFCCDVIAVFVFKWRFTS